MPRPRSLLRWRGFVACYPWPFHARLTASLVFLPIGEFFAYALAHFNVKFPYSLLVLCHSTNLLIRADNPPRSNSSASSVELLRHR